MKKTPQEIMQMAVAEARRTMNAGLGGPFGAAIVAPDGRVFVGSNTVLGSKDPTAHAEVNAIRKACRELGTHDLSGCVLYTTCFPCPMCLSACIWANIREVWYGSTPEDADKVGFRDDYIYRYIKGGCKDDKVLKIAQEGREVTIKIFEEYAEEGGQLY